MSFDSFLLPPAYRACVHHYPSVTSTMDVAAQLLRGEGAAIVPLTCVVADEQSAGRGRQGKSWTTFPGHSLACTFVLPVPAGRAANGSHLPLIAALTIFQALKTIAADLSLQIKWPNDLLLTANNQTGKVAGMLIEATPAGHLFGLGLNLGRSPAMTEAFQGLVLSDALPTAPAREAVLAALFPCLENNLAVYRQQGWTAFHQEYVRHCVTIGQEVVWKNAAKEELRGLALGLHEQTGALQLRTGNGTVHLIHSGDVVAQGQVHA